MAGDTSGNVIQFQARVDAMRARSVAELGSTVLDGSITINASIDRLLVALVDLQSGDETDANLMVMISQGVMPILEAQLRLLTSAKIAFARPVAGQER